MVAIFVVLFLWMGGLQADPPGRASNWGTSQRQITDNWDAMSPGQRDQALADNYNANDPYMWASLSQEQQQRKIDDLKRIINQMTPEERAQFMSMNSAQRQEVLYRHYTQQQKPGEALQDVVDQTNQADYNYGP
jgi:predicted Fe-S protein YdhL (DUF1289 family)